MVRALHRLLVEHVAHLGVDINCAVTEHLCNGMFLPTDVSVNYLPNFIKVNEGPSPLLPCHVGAGICCSQGPTVSSSDPRGW